MSAKRKITNMVSFVAIVVLMATCTEAQAQRAPVQIGGPNGIVMGGGMGFKVGGRNGIHFGGGQGAKFGPTEFGMHFGNGQGARFGGKNAGMQFGGGQGARFGTPEFGMQFGRGEGARFGSKENPIIKFGGNGTVRELVANKKQQTEIDRKRQQTETDPNPVLEGPLDGTELTAPTPMAAPGSFHPNAVRSGTVSVLEK